MINKILVPVDFSEHSEYGNTSKAKIYVKLEHDSEYKNGDADYGLITFESSDPKSITFKGATNGVLQIGLTEQDKDENKHQNTYKALPSIEVECLKSFANEIKITAKTGKGREIGQLLVYPNQTEYTVTVQPVLITLGASTDSKSVDIATSSLTQINTSDLEKQLNEHSLNQALIKCAIAPMTQTFTFDKSIVREYLKKEGGKEYLTGDDNQRKLFNEAIENQYSTIIEGTHAEEITKKNEAYNKSSMHSAIQNYLKAIDKKFKYNTEASNKYKEVSKALEDTKIKNAVEHKIIKNGSNGVHDLFLVAEQKMNAMLKRDGITSSGNKPMYVGKIPKVGTIYIFLYPDIEASYADDFSMDLTKGEVPGYTSRGGGLSHIFKECFTLPDAIAHELGHALGLQHTFEKELGNTNSTLKTQEEYDKEIEQMKENLNSVNLEEKKYNKGLKSIISSGLTDSNEYPKYESMDRYYTRIKNLSENFIDWRKNYNSYLRFNDFLDKLKAASLYENDLSKIKIHQDIKSITQIKADKAKVESEIKILEAKKNSAPKNKDLKGDLNYKAQSTTLENYMDYDFDDAGITNTDFERKTLTKQQWDIIRENGGPNGYLKL